MAKIVKSTARDASRKCSEQASKEASNVPPQHDATKVSIAPRADAAAEQRATKQERMLTLLSRPEGASVAEMMQATSWQQHSVRGFLAGTVKKKLVLPLASSKATDDVRRYRIKSRRGR